MANKSEGRSTAKTAFVIGAVSALAISAIGFGVMLVFWRIESLQYISKYGEEFGFFHWKAATWGDGLCLPILVGSLVAYKLLLGKITKKEKNLSLCIGGVLWVIAGIVQASWLISDTTKPNWTIPELHYFMPSGWYHAVYFCFMFFVIGLLLSQVFFARRRSFGCYSKENLPELFVQVLMWFSGVGYVFMNNIDDRYSGSNYFYLSLITLAFFFIAIGFYSFLSIPREKRKTLLQDELVCIAAGLVGAFGLCLLVYHGTTDNLFVFTGALIAVSCVLPNSKNMPKTFFSYSYLFPPHFGCFLQ